MTLTQDTARNRPTGSKGARRKRNFDVLLIEDNAGDAVLIRQILGHEDSAIRVHVAVDGEQALHMLVDEDIQPALIILDLNVPRIPGLSLLARWQSSPVPIVVFSSSWNDAEINRALELGAREFVHKPDDLDEFAHAVSEIVNRWMTPESSGR